MKQSTTSTPVTDARRRRFDTREHSTYTDEEPNSLSPDLVPKFLGKMRELHPAHFAFTFVVFTTGLRPSSLRPLRREGPHANVMLDEGVLLIRRSQTIGDEVMETTKTDLHQRLTQPKELLDVLRWHVDEPRGMPRTYQDLARAGGAHDAVTRAISGHATTSMQLHYSTANGSGVKQALSKVAKIASASAKVIDIGSARRRKQLPPARRQGAIRKV